MSKTITDSGHEVMEAQLLTDGDMKQLTERHYEEVMCRECKEWTMYGESCCGATQCESVCPVCKEVYGEY